MEIYIPFWLLLVFGYIILGMVLGALVIFVFSFGVPKSPFDEPPWLLKCIPGSLFRLAMGSIITAMALWSLPLVAFGLVVIVMLSPIIMLSRVFIKTR